ncbi:hypothetical protein BV22DRAFT_1127793 [Leucogyrophana mollusca]|uniref:Uncharacterized protein n=1 Tax=Leucogyrophana mollusca TaxID=85980 RepID=A0ACB8BNS6_9AGAM|nr:hypothetical protein BV22DRAFT_1127793 [Leucogyrophana mollusca]
MDKSRADTLDAQQIHSRPEIPPCRHPCRHPPSRTPSQRLHRPSASIHPRHIAALTLLKLRDDILLPAEPQYAAVSDNIHWEAFSSSAPSNPTAYTPSNPTPDLYNPAARASPVINATPSNIVSAHGSAFFPAAASASGVAGGIAGLPATFTPAASPPPTPSHGAPPPSPHASRAPASSRTTSGSGVRTRLLYPTGDYALVTLALLKLCDDLCLRIELQYAALLDSIHWEAFASSGQSLCSSPAPILTCCRSGPARFVKDARQSIIDLVFDCPPIQESQAPSRKRARDHAKIRNLKKRRLDVDANGNAEEDGIFVRTDIGDESAEVDYGTGVDMEGVLGDLSAGGEQMSSLNPPPPSDSHPHQTDPPPLCLPLGAEPLHKREHHSA